LIVDDLHNLLPCVDATSMIKKMKKRFAKIRGTTLCYVARHRDVTCAKDSTRVVFSFDSKKGNFKENAAIQLNPLFSKRTDLSQQAND